MSNEELIQRVWRSAPITDEQVEALDLEQAGSELMEAIIEDSPAAESSPMRSRRTARFGRQRLALRVGAALAGAAVAAALIVTGDEAGDDRDGVAYAAEWIRIAKENPRLLVSAPGWAVTRADESRPDYGEMQFANGDSDLYLNWYPVDLYDAFFRDRAHDTDMTKIELLGRPATLFSDEFNNHSVMFRPGGDTFVEIDSDDDRTMARDEFLDLLETLQAVDVDTWLAALPPSVVQPGERVATVEEMLAGIPVPPGLDLDSLTRGETSRERYKLGALVTGAVTCAWLERRMSGLQTGDAAKVRQAEDALATARRWPILLEMRDEGGWPQAIWDWAEDGRGSSGYGRDSTQRPVGALGCSPDNWRGVPSIDPRFR